MKNTVATILKGYAIVHAIAGLTMAMMFARPGQGITTLVWMASVLITSFIIYAFGEVIGLLQDIKTNTAKTARRVHSAGSDPDNGDLELLPDGSVPAGGATSADSAALDESLILAKRHRDSMIFYVIVGSVLMILLFFVFIGLGL